MNVPHKKCTVCDGKGWVAGHPCTRCNETGRVEETTLEPELTARVLEAVRRERVWQDLKWGEQNHPRGKWMLILQEELGEAAEVALQGLEARDRREFLAELLQVAAVAIAWLESEMRAYEYDLGIREPTGIHGQLGGYDLMPEDREARRKKLPF